MYSSEESGMGVLGTIADVLAIPYNLMAGLILGFIAPIAAIAAMVAGVRLITGKMPFISMQKAPGQDRSLALNLIPPEQVKERFEEQKEELGEELSHEARDPGHHRGGQGRCQASRRPGWPGRDHARRELERATSRLQQHTPLPPGACFFPRATPAGHRQGTVPGVTKRHGRPVPGHDQLCPGPTVRRRRR